MSTLIRIIQTVKDKTRKNICIFYSYNQYGMFVKLCNEMSEKNINFSSIKIDNEFDLESLTEIKGKFLIIINNLDYSDRLLGSCFHLLEINNTILYIESGDYYSEKLIEHFEANDEEIQNNNDIIGFQFKRSKKLRVTSSEGTDIKFELHNDTANKDDLRAIGKSDIIQFPYGEVYFPIKEGTANGVLVTDGKKYNIKNGRLGYEDRMTNIPICEFGIGTNKSLLNYKEAYQNAFYEKVYGTCHFGFGDNTNFGGDIKFPYHFDLVIEDYVCFDFDNEIIIDNTNIENLPNYLIELKKTDNWEIKVDVLSYGKNKLCFYNPYSKLNFSVFDNTSKKIDVEERRGLFSLYRNTDSITFIYEIPDLLWIGAPVRNLPFPYERKEIYNVYLKNLKDSQYYTNNSKNLNKLIVIDKSNVINKICEISDTTLIYSALSDEGTQEIQKFLDYLKFYINDINCKVLKVRQSFASGLSYENMIVIKEYICKNEKFMIFKYLIHEIIHQYLGFKIRFENKFVCEILTEFLQILYIKKRFSKTLYLKYLKYYKDVIRTDRDEDNYCQGILAFEKVYTHTIQTEENLQKLFAKMSLNGKVDYEYFKTTMKELFNIKNFDDIFFEIKNTYK